VPKYTAQARKPQFRPAVGGVQVEACGAIKSRMGEGFIGEGQARLIRMKKRETKPEAPAKKRDTGLQVNATKATKKKVLRKAFGQTGQAGKSQPSPRKRPKGNVEGKILPEGGPNQSRRESIAGDEVRKRKHGGKTFL